MASTPALVERRVKEDHTYRPLFIDAFATQEITFEKILEAIASYERTLITPSAFDAYLKGDDDAINNAAKNGLKLFINLGCKGGHV
ncbi:MAG: hypothetical protein FAF05_04455 [Epsilonproteobacteria bacterium]|nr:hypothetical protein [Campylobacterota bacterium]